MQLLIWVSPFGSYFNHKLNEILLACVKAFYIIEREAKKKKKKKKPQMENN